MTRAPKTKSLASKLIIAVVICAIVFALVAYPLLQRTTFNAFLPYFAESITNKAGNCAANMSLFLGISNPTMYSLTLTDDFRGAVRDYMTGAADDAFFENFTDEHIAPFDVDLSDAGTDFSCTCYPAVYIEGKGVFGCSGVDEAVNVLLDSEWFRDYTENYEGRYLYSPVITTADGTDYFCYLYSASADDTGGAIYYSVLLTKYDDVLRLWKDITDMGIDDFAFIDLGDPTRYQNMTVSELAASFGSEGIVLYQNLENTMLDYDWMAENLISSRQHHVVSHTAKDETLFSVLVSYQTEGLRFVMRAPNSLMHSVFSGIYLMIYAILISFVAVFIIVILVIFRSIFRRLYVLSEKMAAVQSGNYDIKVNDSGNDEIGQLASAFNTMTDKIRDNVNKLVENEQREKLMQYNLMVSAIDPHFVNNTLNTSTRLAELGRTEDVVAVNDALINLLKNNLKTTSTQVYDTVSNELVALEEYIKIQNYLCDNTIDLLSDMSEEERSLVIPKFLLQPIVENAILHGILMNIDEKGENIPGKIVISAKEKDGRITVKVKDNGIGMSRETIDKYFADTPPDDAPGEHIGILNVRTRLAHLFNDNYSFTAESTPGKGTTVTINIPEIRQ